MHELSATTWAALDHVLQTASPLDEHARASAWDAMMDGELVIVARRSIDARTHFLACTRDAGLRVPLDARTRTVTALVGRGLSYKEIAFELGLSNASVWRSITSACRALGVSDRIELAIVAAAFGPTPSGAPPRSVRCARLAIDGEDYVALGASIAESPLWARLSQAERAVTELALAGHPGATIAHLRGLRSARTVANQLDQVFRKTGVSGRAQLATRLIAG
jgi:DNA-binding NarL/FixJ family response regulator